MASETAKAADVTLVSDLSASPTSIEVEPISKAEAIVASVADDSSSVASKAPAEVTNDARTAITAVSEAGGLLNTPVEVAKDAKIEELPLPETKPEVVPAAETKPEVVPAAETKPEVVPAAETKPEVVPAAETKSEVVPAAETKSEEPGHGSKGKEATANAPQVASTDAKPVNVSLLVTGENAVSLLLAVNDSGSAVVPAAPVINKLVRVSLMVDAEQMVNVKLDTVESAAALSKSVNAPKKVSPLARFMQFFQRRGSGEVKAQVTKPAKADPEPAQQRPAFGAFGCCAHPAVQAS